MTGEPSTAVGLLSGFYVFWDRNPATADRVVQQLAGASLFGLSPQIQHSAGTEAADSSVFYWGPDAGSYFLFDNIRDEIMVRFTLQGNQPSCADIGKVLARVGLSDLEPNAQWISPHAISGGQQQRLMTALLLTYVPPVIVAQTPLVYVDEASREELYHLLDESIRDAGCVLVLLGENEEVISRLSAARVSYDGSRLVQVPPMVTTRSSTTAPAYQPPSSFGGKERVVEIANGKWTYPDGRVGVTIDSFVLDTGEICVVCGPNGGGKSSLLRIMFSDWRVPRSTVIRFRSREIRNPFRDLVRKGRIVFTLQDPNFHSRPVTVREAVESAGMQRGLIDNLHLSEYYDNDLITAPFWLKQALSLGTALSSNADILLLDEPIDGFAYDVLQGGAVKAIQLVRDTGRAVLIVTHNAELGCALGDRYVWIENRSIAEVVNRQEVFNGSGVVTRWLGI